MNPRALLHRLFQTVRAFLGRSIQRQLAFAFGSVSLILMLTLAWLVTTHERSFLHHQSTERATALAHALAVSSASWVVARDIAGLQEVVRGFAGTPDLRRAYVLSLRGEVLGSLNDAEIGKYVRDARNRSLLVSPSHPHILANDARQIDVAVPVKVGNHMVGWARVEFGQDSVNANLREVSWAGLGFAVLGVLAATLIAMLLAAWLTRRLRHLMEVANAVESGRHDVRADPGREDELGALAVNLNRMLDAQEEAERKLARLNRVYAAWTESMDAIVRAGDEQSLLEGICRILAERVPFKLVWVGRVDEDQWVRVVAASDPQSDYLKRIHISVDETRPEGRVTMSQALRSGQPRIHNDFSHDTRVPWRAAAEAEGFLSVGAFPLMRGGRCYGAIGVYAQERDFFDAELITLMHGLADDVSFALDALDRERQRREAEAKLILAARVFENSKEGILITDAGCNIISVNRAFTEISGYTEAEVLGRNPRILASGRHDKAFYREMWESIESVGSWQGEIWNRRKNGQEYIEWLVISCVRDDAGRVINYLGIFNDITERKLSEDYIRQLAHYDALTGLPNRMLMRDRLEHAIVMAQRSGDKVALLFLDLDRFKQINDTLGHGVGDALLKAAADRLLNCVREQDTVSRQGGDEFIAMLPGTDVAGAEKVAGKILKEIVRPFEIGGHVLRISSSIGICVYPEHAQDIEALVKNADLAMYDAKAKGRNNYRVYDVSMNASAFERLQMENDLRAALEQGQFELHYQPQFDLKSGALTGCEALVRWRHPDRGMVSPASFIPVAEECGLIGQIGDWVLEEAIRQSSAWQAAGLSPVTVAVNLSALQFQDRDLAGQVRGLLAEHGLSVEWLDLELTESVLMQGIERTLETLHQLSNMGLRLAVDDFGTGYSSLAYLKLFPIQKLKIDQTFVRDIMLDPNDAIMVRAIVVMAHSLGLAVVAEGVETEEQASFLRTIGCNQAQGYLYGRPVPAAEFVEKFLRRR
ncbi:MAG: EAL domain-containing protein [Methylophilaceae bacterium]|nr:EAL domain-containing protein [Methylophilaceae bacterium]